MGRHFLQRRTESVAKHVQAAIKIVACKNISCSHDTPPTVMRPIRVRLNSNVVCEWPRVGYIIVNISELSADRKFRPSGGSVMSGAKKGEGEMRGITRGQKKRERECSGRDRDASKEMDMLGENIYNRGGCFGVGEESERGDAFFALILTN